MTTVATATFSVTATAVAFMILAIFVLVVIIVHSAEQFAKENNDDAQILIVAHNGILRAIHWNIVGYNDETNLREFRLQNGEIREYDIQKSNS